MIIREEERFNKNVTFRRNNAGAVIKFTNVYTDVKHKKHILSLKHIRQ